VNPEHLVTMSLAFLEDLNDKVVARSYPCMHYLRTAAKEAFRTADTSATITKPECVFRNAPSTCCTQCNNRNDLYTPVSLSATVTAVIY
jgi:hypothetical protein